MSYGELIGITESYQSREKCEEVDDITYHNGIQGIMKKLDTSPTFGIASSTADERREAYGSNRAPEPPVKGFCQLFCEAMNDIILIILCGAAVVSIVIHMIVEEKKYLAWIEGFAIMVAVLLCAGTQAL